MNKFKELYSYKEMIINLTLYDLRTRYKGSVFGFLWTFLNPLLLLGIYSLVFSTVMRMDIDYYYIFMFIGLLPWIMFQSSLQVGTGSIVRNSNLIKKIYFPREVLPLSVLLGSLINYLFGLIILIPFLFFLKLKLSIIIIWFPIVLLIHLILTFGLILLFSSLNVYFRDVEHIIGVLVTAWFYFTPVIYPSDLIPKKYEHIFSLNPLKPIFDLYHDLFYYGRVPVLNTVWICLLVAIIFFSLGWIVFAKLNKNFAEEI
ncbi:ABC transporter permease [Paenibacillus filicis]|uniref:Transport permease protein n=1 Tax=Paenibacillus gyeongsangnamensis TaxID=3388067 RepID=A0ABT4Q6Q6_9BACL|nr:ABC transporter permease [Paenibacillus filicis]MCZ8512552.1 ABC transporter permease [Paenibacillus filicis]